MTPPASKVIGDVCASVAAVGLGDVRPPLPDEPLADDVWDRLLAAVRGHRLAGLFATAVAGALLATTDEQAASAEDEFAAAARVDLVVERDLVEAADLLARAGVPTRVLKGSAVAHLDYPDPGLRSFGDVDVLVPPAGWDDAVAALAAAGLRRRFPEPRPGFDRRFTKGAAFVTPAGHEVDLHRTFAMGPFGLTIDLDDLWARSEPFEVGGRDLAALGREERFLHACYHAVLGDRPARLVPLRDVLQISAAPSFDAGRAVALARAWGGEPVVAAALAEATARLGAPTPPALAAWAEGYRPGARAERALAAYTGTDGYARKSLAAVRALPRWRDKLAFVTALALPRREYVRARHGGHTARWRRAARRLTTRGPGR